MKQERTMRKGFFTIEMLLIVGVMTAAFLGVFAIYKKIKTANLEMIAMQEVKNTDAKITEVNGQITVETKNHQFKMENGNLKVSKKKLKVACLHKTIEVFEEEDESFFGGTIYKEISTGDLVEINDYCEIVEEKGLNS